jgi:hypothetical protein
MAAATLQRSEYENRIATLRTQMAGLIAQHAALADERRALQAGPLAPRREERIRAIEGQAECEKAGQVRNAWMTGQALEHSQPRPSAWWFPAVDPSGAWFQAVSETAEFHWQTLTGEACAGAIEPDRIDTISI